MDLIFDLDGTLFQTDICTINAVRKICEEMDVPEPSEQLVRKAIGMKTLDFLHEIFPDTEIRDTLIQRYRELERRQISSSGKLFADVMGTLNGLKDAGHKLYVCSNGSNEYIELVLKTMRIYQLFDGFFSAGSFNSKTEAVSLIKKRCGRPVMIGDTDTDSEAAASSGIPFIYAIYGFGSKEYLGKAVFIMTEFAEMTGYVKQLEIFYSIFEKARQKESRIIGINGVDTSGKTFFTNRFSAFLEGMNIRNQIIHIDDFHNPRRIRRKGRNEVDAYYQNAFDYRKLLDEVLLPAESGNLHKKIYCLDLNTDRYEKQVQYTVYPDTVILIEGVLLFRRPLIDHIDEKVFLDISFETMIQRAGQRDVPLSGKEILQKYNSKYIPVQKRYLEEEQPKLESDFVIDNNDYFNPVIVKQTDC